jgi:hypothetical protein
MRAFPYLALAALASCTPGEEIDGVKPEGDKYDSSAVAVFVDLTFKGELLTDAAWSPEQQIEDQLLYTIGQLNGANSVGRLDTMTLTNVRTKAEGGRTKITYDAKLPVAWGKKNDVPDTFTLKLPKDMGSQALQRFMTSYGHDCVEAGAHDVDQGSLWYYFRPARSGCRFAAADIYETVATVSPSAVQTTGKFPEYDKLWEDGALNLVAVFGKYEDGATSGDAGIEAYDEFVDTMKRELGQLGTVTSSPAQVPSSPGVGHPDIELRVTTAAGKTIKINALLTDNVRDALDTEAFRARYAALSTRADVIVYNGHAGLGTNVRAMAAAGEWVAGQYVIVFLNGCDTFAYVDDALNAAHAAVNPSDTTGTKHVDIVLNGMPAFFASMSGATLSLFRGLADAEEPRTYEQIFRDVDRSQVVLVTGEQDNTFTPGASGGGGTGAWEGLVGSGSVAKGAEKRFETPALAPGRYTFSLTGSGDADLYVRIGKAPTTRTYDCRPYKTGSTETCDVVLTQAAPVHVMVRGYAASSSFELAGRKN